MREENKLQRPKTILTSEEAKQKRQLHSGELYSLYLFHDIKISSLGLWFDELVNKNSCGNRIRLPR
jgi:hypothetical protein